MKLKFGDFKEVTWSDVRLLVKKFSPDLFHAIEQFSPDSQYKLYLAEYAYGAPIIDDNGIFNIQVDNKMMPITSPDMPGRLRSQLSYHYHGMPLGILIKGQMQLSSYKNSGYINPDVIFQPGDMFAAQAAMDLPNKYQASYYWRMNAGVRTVYLLPSISDRVKFNRLSRYFDLACDMPVSQYDHWSLFQSLANCTQFQEDWTCQCLFFGKKFVEKLNLLPELYAAIARRVMLQTIHTRTDTIGRMWEELLPKIRNKKVDHYILDMSKHVISASLGKSLLFRVADAKNQAGPLNMIAKILVDVYGLERYAPVFMIPQCFQHGVTPSGYISIQHPAVGLKRKTNNKSKYLMSDFREIKYVLDAFIANTKREVIDEVPVYDFNRYQYSYYTADADSYGTFDNASTVFNHDPDIDAWLQFGSKQINTRNSFLRACIKVK